MMLSAIQSKKKNIVNHLAVAGALLISGCVLSSSAMAFTCDDVRGLSTAEQNFWAKRLGITQAERHHIWVACYRDYRPGLQAQLVRR
jgi:hypothetical protein